MFEAINNTNDEKVVVKILKVSSVRLQGLLLVRRKLFQPCFVLLFLLLLILSFFYCMFQMLGLVRQEQSSMAICLPFSFMVATNTFALECES